MIFNVTMGIAYNDHTWEEVEYKNIKIEDDDMPEDSVLNDFCFNIIKNNTSHINNKIVSGYFIIHLEGI